MMRSENNYFENHAVALNIIFKQPLPLFACRSIQYYTSFFESHDVMLNIVHTYST